MTQKKHQGKIFLAGGGDEKDSFLVDQNFVSSLIMKKVLYIPVALERDVIGFETAYDWLVGALNQHCKNFIDISMWLNLEGKKIEDIIKFDAIYIGGGNTYKLLKEMYESEFNLLLLEFLNMGKIVYGGSAGAIILGKTIAIVEEENTINYQKNEGLSLLGDYSIICHYDVKKDIGIKKFINEKKCPVLCVPEKSGVVIENNDVKVIGEQPIYFFECDGNEITVKPGEIYKI